MGTSAKGTLGIVLESLTTPGLVQLYSGAISASFSLTTQPSGSTGMRILLVVQGNTTTGTMTITGTNVSNGAINETTPTIGLPPAGQNSLVTAFEYVTTNVFASVNSSGVTSTGLANGVVTIYGIQAAKYLIPCIADIEKDYKYFTPKEARGLLDEETSMQQLVIDGKISKIDQALYPEDSLFIGYMGFSNTPTVTTIPASPTSLKASSAVSGGPFSLSTQPTAPGMVLIFTVTSSSATGTITITNGTNQYGVTVSETIQANGTNGNGTYYSANVYSAVPSSGVSFTGLTSGSCGITGVYGWQYSFVPDGNALYSAALEWYTGTDSTANPWAFLDEIDIDFSVEKETKVALKGGMQDKLPIGDRTTNPLSASRVSALGQPLDIPLIGWQTAVYIDAISGTPGTTAYSSVIDGKVNIKVPQQPIYTATQTQRYARLYRKQRSAMLTAAIDFVALDQYEKWRQNIQQYINFQFFGAYIGSIGGTVYNKSWSFIFPAQYAKFKVDASKLENVTADLEAHGIYSASAGFSHKLVIVNQQPPVYTA